MSHPADNRTQGHPSPICPMKLSTGSPAPRKRIPAVVSCLFAILLVTGCASTKVSDRQILVKEKLPRPDHILVYDFATTPAEIPGDSALAGKISEQSTPPTAEQMAAGRQISATIAGQLVRDIRDMGLPAQRASRETTPQINDIVIRGYLLSVDEGSTIKRVTIGFGAGGSELKVAVEGYQMTDQGLRKIGSGTGQAGGGKTPGAAVGVAALIATANPVGLIVGGG